MKKQILTILSVGIYLFSSVALAQDKYVPLEQKIQLKKVITDIPATSYDFLKSSFSKESLPGWGLLIGSSAVLYHYDEDLYLGSQNTGRRWGLEQTDHTKTVLKLGKYDILRLPTDTASWMYFLGDGWLDAAVAGGFFATGYFGDHSRPYNTALQLAHGMIISGVIAQGIKRSTGRESPSDRTTPSGAWRPFPNTKDYDANTSKYDAVPSGHMMTSTLVWTIIRLNYPEYDHILFPTEVVWLSTLGFAMMNNGVHWASDYPLGFAIGYMVAHSSVKLGQQDKEDKKPGEASSWMYVPGANAGVATLNAVKYF